MSADAGIEFYAGRQRSWERPPTREQFAREQMDLPSEWQVYLWEAIGWRTGSGKSQGALLTGAVPDRLITRGKRKGQPNWRKLKPGTKATVAVLDDAFDVWLLGWERATDACYKCAGSGRVFASWDHIEGTRYRDCRRCNATGNAPKDALAEAEPTILGMVS